MAGRSQAPSFRTDVNRMKTQKWAQAAKANYGGDEWGGYDEYDDYDEPAPLPKPTGLRQRGQGTNTANTSTSTSSPERPSFAQEASSGNSQSLQTKSQAQEQLNTRPRAGSFEAGDDHAASEPSARAETQPPPSSSQASLFAAVPAQQSPILEPFQPPIQSREPLSNLKETHGQPNQPPGNALHPNPRSGYSSHARHGSQSQQPLTQSASRIVQGPYQPPPRQDSKAPQPDVRGSRPGQAPPQGSSMRPPPYQGTPSPSGGRPHGSPRGSPSNGPPSTSSDYFPQRGYTPPGGHPPQQGPRPRPPPSQDYGPRKRPSQEYGPRKPPSQEFRLRSSPSSEPRLRQSPSQELRARQSPSQEFKMKKSPSQEFRPPPRKDSLSSGRRPSNPSVSGDAPSGTQSRVDGKSHEEGQSPAARSLSPATTQASAPAFVRPADIYRRVEEEKERQRASMDSSRPSMDSIERGIRLSSQGQPPARSSQDSSRDVGAASLLKPTLDPVVERKSEYGLEGFIAQDPEFAKVVGEQIAPNPASQPSLAPSLPQFGRFSSFGMDSLGFMHNEDQLKSDSNPAMPTAQTFLTPSGAQESVQQRTRAQPTSAHEHHPDHQQEETDLQHQPSLGFRSAVNQAFDGNPDGSARTPTSVHGSQRSKDGSDVSRSDTTNSTGEISPIMSRVPSAATAENRSLDATLRAVKTPAIKEEANESSPTGSRPASSETLKGPLNVDGTSHSRHPSNESASASVKAGYRRSMQPPNTNNTPTHVTAISPRKEFVEHSQEGEIAMTTPVDNSQDGSESYDAVLDDQKTPDAIDMDFTRHESNIGSQDPISNLKNAKPPALASAEPQVQTSFIAAHKGHAPGISTESLNNTSPVSRSGSPSTKGRVRDLASKYNDIHHASKTGAESPSGSMSSWSSRSGPSPIIGKEENNTLESPSSFTEEPAKIDPTPKAKKATSDLPLPQRPSIPGGWVSYAPSEASAAPSADNYDSTIDQHSVGDSSSQIATPKVKTEPSSESDDFAPDTNRDPSAGRTHQGVTDNPMAALSAAGTALAESLKQATGITEGTESSGTLQGRKRSEIDKAQRANYTITDKPSVGPSTSLQTIEKYTPEHDAKRHSSGYVPPTAPLNVRKDSVGSPVKQTHQEPDSATSATSTHLSLDPSASDTEADRLRKDIARSLSPPQSPPAATGLAPVSERHSAVSSVFPSEYDAYWANQEGQKLSTSTTRLSRGSQDKAPSLDISRPSQHNEHQMGSTKRVSSQSATKSSFPASHDSWEKSNFGDDGLQKFSLSAWTPEKATRSAASNQIQQMPPELQARSISGGASAHVQQRAAELPTPEPRIYDADSKSSGSTFKDLRSAPKLSPDQTGMATSAKLPEPRPFKEIMDMKTTAERIESYQNARVYFATQDTGLNNWLAHMVQKHPEHASAVAAPMRPIVNTSGLAGSVRNKMPPSITKFGKTTTSDYPSSTGVTPDSASPGSNSIRDSPSVSRRQEFLHQGKVFSGRASQGAKGLLAKGKSRLRGSDKELPPLPYESNQSQPQSESRSDAPSLDVARPRLQESTVERDAQPLQTADEISSSIAAQHHNQAGEMYDDEKIAVEAEEESEAYGARGYSMWDKISGTSAPELDPAQPTSDISSQNPSQNNSEYYRNNQLKHDRRDSHTPAPAPAPPLEPVTEPLKPQKSRSRLSKRHTIIETKRAGSNEQKVTENQPKKRFSVIGTLIGRSTTSKTEPRIKDSARSNKLVKGSRRKSSDLLSQEQTPHLPAPHKISENYEPAPIPPLPVSRPHSQVITEPRSQEQQTNPVHLRAETSDLNYVLDEYASYFNSGDTPAFETPGGSSSDPALPPPPGADRQQHVRYLQSQGVFPTRGPTQHASRQHRRADTYDGSQAYGYRHDQSHGNIYDEVPNRRQTMPLRQGSQGYSEGHGESQWQSYGNAGGGRFYQRGGYGA